MLDILERVSKILLTGVASTVIAAAGLNIEWQKIGIEEDSWCFEHADRVQAAYLRHTETIPELLINRYAVRCNVAFKEAARILNEDKVIAELSADAESLPEGSDQSSPDLDPQSNPIIDGFVALGRTQPTSYAQVNFDNASDGDPIITNGLPPSPGTVLKARWTVNLRENSTITTSNQNPILAVIGEDECITVSEEPQALRGQFWAPITRTECPR